MNSERPRESKQAALVKVPDAAHELAISKRSAWRLISAGKLDTVRIGRSVRVTRESIERFIASGGEAK
ncbi:MAG: helix-turn-helix domain-containing protein [Vicinamibacterales bacterium]